MQWIYILCHLGLYKKIFLLSCIHQFQSDIINNMDHMRISGADPSSVILSQTKEYKNLKWYARKVSEQGMVL